MFILILVRNFIVFFNLILMNNYEINRSKNSCFECGFENFESIRLPFSIQFYIIRLLFLVFDVEIIYLFPILISIKLINYLRWFISSLFILMILFLGLEYEKFEGLLK